MMLSKILYKRIFFLLGKDSSHIEINDIEGNHLEKITRSVGIQSKTKLLNGLMGKVDIKRKKEFIPDFKIEIINTDRVGDAIRKNVVVDASNDGTKKYKCKFCQKLYAGKIVDHYFAVHKEEPKI